ncbi:MAG: hypothetical protein PHE73_09040 [Sulfurovaceae bacterium]|nr:hypothetical protein [Sulfurovaceae bacterium]
MKNNEKLCCVALVFALLALGLSGSSTTTGIQWVVNNTNLAPFVASHGGTGERIGDNTTYWNNNSPIEIFLYSHANTTGVAAEVHLFINGTKVADTSGRPLGVAEISNQSIIATIPQYSYYSVEMVNYHHYEWYEYQILTGNVTTTWGGIINSSQLDLKINKSGDNITNGVFYSSSSNKISYLDFSSSYVNLYTTNTITGLLSRLYSTGDSLVLAIENANTNVLTLSENNTTLDFGGSTKYTFSMDELDVGNKNITNCANCIVTGNYTADGTTNRFIPYSLFRTASKIDIMSDEIISQTGTIIQPGYIASTQDGVKTAVTAHNSTGFFVSGNWNLIAPNNQTEIGTTVSTYTTQSGYVFYYPVRAGTTGNVINISLNSQTGVGSGRMALYSDSASIPSTLLNESASAPFITGWTNFSIVYPVLNQTNYWLAVQIQNNSEVVYGVGSGILKYHSYVYAAFPATTPALSSGTVTFNMRWYIQGATPKYYWVAI